MPEIKQDFGDGGANLIPNDQSGSPSLADVLRGGVTDHESLRTAFIALLKKLDLDAGVTDTDYESSLTPAAQVNTKG